MILYCIKQYYMRLHQIVFFISVILYSSFSYHVVIYYIVSNKILLYYIAI